MLDILRAVDKENNGWHAISFFTSLASYSQLNDQPTHITKTSLLLEKILFSHLIQALLTDQE